MKTQTTLKLVKTLITSNDNAVELKDYQKENKAEMLPETPNNDAALKEFFDRSKYFD